MPCSLLRPRVVPPPSAHIQGLSDLGFELVSTGGSAKAIEGDGVPVKKVEDLTGFPEMLDGAQGLQALVVLVQLPCSGHAAAMQRRPCSGHCGLGV